MILVIGGAGYTGSHMVKWLLQRDEDVLVMDTFEKGHLEAVVGGTIVEGDLRRRCDPWSYCPPPPLHPRNRAALPTPCRYLVPHYRQG
jgi:nucleoside-diphosphate-sugar epimerase